ncbi:MAG: hypothetical protein K9M07_04865 [Simkaniaceae bacterium]|nr:hypothetical protein [Simkaniaceae bacterium]
MRYIIFSLFFLMISIQSYTFDRVIIWGHKLHSHTHSYIHHGFYRAFKALGYSTYWVDSLQDLHGIELSNSLFLTEGQCTDHIPLRKDCDYILHNVDQTQWKNKVDENRILAIQVFTIDVLKRQSSEHSVEIEPYLFFSKEHKILYMPWATDLLPDEIEQNKLRLKTQGISNKNHLIAWVGTIGQGEFGNSNEIHRFVNEAKHLNPKIRFDPGKKNLSMEGNCTFISKAYLAPAIVGQWQKKQGYIPCRIFKNISYGAMGITNSYHTWKLFKEKIIYHPNEKTLFHLAQERMKSYTLEDQLEIMDFVKDHHTYINRIQTILKCLNTCKGV